MLVSTLIILITFYVKCQIVSLLVLYSFTGCQMKWLIKAKCLFVQVYVWYANVPVFMTKHCINVMMLCLVVMLVFVNLGTCYGGCCLCRRLSGNLKQAFDNTEMIFIGHVIDKRSSNKSTNIPRYDFLMHVEKAFKVGSYEISKFYLLVIT
jgi:hypothetical protein